MSRKKLRVAFVSPEITPYAKTGGLADVAGTLPKEIRALGQEVICFLPKYKKIDMSRWPIKEVVEKLQIPLGSEVETGRVFRYDEPNGNQVYFIDQPEYFSRDELYGTPLGDYPDNDRRFIFFQRGVLEALKKLNLKVDLIHGHDWQAGLISPYLKTLYLNDPFFAKTKSIFTIHNLGYQGNFPPDSHPLSGLSWDMFRLERLEFWGKVSFLKGALVYADALTTVSPRYAKEIQTKEFGSGMEGILQNRRDDVVGIVNGIDPEEWNPETDPDIPFNFNAKKLDGKAQNKAALQKENQFPVDPKIPIFSIIARLADQKGLDILAASLEGMVKRGIQFVLLGTGDEKYQQIFRELGKKYPKQLGIHILFDASMAKRIYASSDVFLMPSRYEPCGLGQLISLRYGTVPLVRETGGLADTVKDFNAQTGEGTGFVFKEYDTKAFLAAVDRALAVFQDQKLWQKLVRNGMKCDFSWRKSAEQYLDLYDRVERKVVIA